MIAQNQRLTCDPNHHHRGVSSVHSIPHLKRLKRIIKYLSGFGICNNTLATHTRTLPLTSAVIAPFPQHHERSDELLCRDSRDSTQSCICSAVHAVCCCDSSSSSNHLQHSQTEVQLLQSTKSQNTCSLVVIWQRGSCGEVWGSMVANFGPMCIAHVLHTSAYRHRGGVVTIAVFVMQQSCECSWPAT